MRMRKGQFSIEFILLFVLVFFIFLIFLGYVGRYITESGEKAERKKLEFFAETLKKELVLAQESAAEISIMTKIPADIDGTQFSAFIDVHDVLIVKHNELDITIIKNIPSIKDSSKTLSAGCYNLKKDSSGEIEIDPVAC